MDILSATLLIVEDDVFTCSVVRMYCEHYFKKVWAVHNTQEAWEIYTQYHPDIILSDIELPDENGLDFIKHIRAKDIRTRIFVLSGYTTEDYLFQAVKLHLEDFIKKPISTVKLEQFIEQCTQKMTILDSVLSHKEEISYCFKRKVLHVRGKEIYLTHMEIGFLELLIAHQGEIVSYEAIEANLYHDKVFGKDALRTLINRLRKKMGVNLVVSHPDLGYRLEKL